MKKQKRNGSFGMEEKNPMKLSSAIACYELMDQVGLLQLKRAFEVDLIKNINTEEGVVFASMRGQIIDGILEERESKHPLALVYHVTLSVPQATHDRLKVLAEKRGETQNALIRRVVKSYLDKKKAE